MTIQSKKSIAPTLVVAFAIGASWIGYMGWPLNGLITRAAEQSNSANRSQTPVVLQDPNCPGNDKHAGVADLNDQAASLQKEAQLFVTSVRAA